MWCNGGPGCGDRYPYYNNYRRRERYYYDPGARGCGGHGCREYRRYHPRPFRNPYGF